MAGEKVHTTTGGRQWPLNRGIFKRFLAYLVSGEGEGGHGGRSGGEGARYKKKSKNIPQKNPSLIAGLPGPGHANRVP